MSKDTRNILIGDLIVLTVSFIWGLVYITEAFALSAITPSWFTFIRIIISIVLLFVLFGKAAFAMSRREKITNTVIGGLYGATLVIAMSALKYTTAGNNSFIVSTFVIFIPLVLWAKTKKFPGFNVLAGTFLAMAGIGILAIGPDFSVNAGDFLSLIVAFMDTAYFILLQKYAHNCDARASSCWQALGALICLAAITFTTEPLPHNITPVAWACIIFCGVIGYAAALYLQTLAQKYTNATHTAIVLSTSGIFGSTLGIIFLNEPLTLKIFTASAMIFSGIMLVEAAPLLKRKHSHN